MYQSHEDPVMLCEDKAAIKLAVNEAWKMGVTVNIIAPCPVMAR